jgi:hypothetical protein
MIAMIAKMAHAPMWTAIRGLRVEDSLLPVL